MDSLKTLIATINTALSNYTPINLPYLGDNTEDSDDREWLIICLLILASFVSVKILFYSEQWAHNIKRNDEILQHLIIPSHCFVVKGRRSTSWIPGRGPKWQVSNLVDPPKSKKWRPLLVFANTKSGNGLGKKVLDECSKILHPLQVHDLGNPKDPPQRTLKILNCLPKQTFTILACGGDGTLNWIFSALDEINPETQPHVACLPLGTGNDLSRVLNWGMGYTRFDRIRSTLASIALSDPVKIDRWFAKINFTAPDPEARGLRASIARKAHTYNTYTRNASKLMAFQNYISIGTDAATMLDFHNSRRAAKDLPVPIFSFSRHFNKFWIGLMAAKNIVDNSRMRDLYKKLKLTMDGKVYEIPHEVECLLFLNVWSWAGGIPVWRQGLTKTTIGQCTKKTLTYGEMDDGLIEVLGFTGGMHLGEVRLNLSQPIRLGQCRSVRLQVLESLPFQADGEPWLNKPAVIDINMKNPRLMLLNRADDYFGLYDEMMEKVKDKDSKDKDQIQQKGQGDTSKFPDQNSLRRRKTMPEIDHSKITVTNTPKHLDLSSNFCNQKSSSRLRHTSTSTLSPTESFVSEISTVDFERLVGNTVSNVAVVQKGALGKIEDESLVGNLSVKGQNEKDSKSYTKQPSNTSTKIATIKETIDETDVEEESQFFYAEANNP